MTASSVLDASALLAYLKDEPGSDEIEALLLAAKEEKEEIHINQINLGEVYYVLARERSLRDAEAFFSGILPFLPVKIFSNSMEDVIAAARLKNRFRLHYTDAFAAVTAFQTKARLITTDRDFEQIEDELDVRWLK